MVNIKKDSHAKEHTIKGSKRFSSARAYLHPALNRKNLFTKINITVDRVVFEKIKEQ